MNSAPGKTAMDQFADCWEGLEDPRTGNAGLHDFHELLMIALCTVLCGGQSAVDMGLRPREGAVPARLSEPGERPAQPRYLQPSVPLARSDPVPGSVSAVHGQVLRAVSGRCGDRWQGSAPLV